MDKILPMRALFAKPPNSIQWRLSTLDFPSAASYLELMAVFTAQNGGRIELRSGIEAGNYTFCIDESNEEAILCAFMS